MRAQVLIAGVVASLAGGAPDAKASLIWGTLSASVQDLDVGYSAVSLIAQLSYDTTAQAFTNYVVLSFKVNGVESLDWLQSISTFHGGVQQIARPRGTQSRPPESLNFRIPFNLTTGSFGTTAVATHRLNGVLVSANGAASFTTVPEPGSMALLGAGLLGLFLARRARGEAAAAAAQA